jgi:crossover junction endodeoxyribonuclease RuvC
MKAEPDVHALVNLLEEWQPTHCYFEKVGGMVGDGASSAFNFGRMAGACEAIVKVSGARFVFVTPQAWKRSMKLRGGREGKDESRSLATSLFPASAAQFRRVKDDGRAEAALLAEYGRRIEDKSIFA